MRAPKPILKKVDEAVWRYYLLGKCEWRRRGIKRLILQGNREKTSAFLLHFPKTVLQRSASGISPASPRESWWWTRGRIRPTAECFHVFQVPRDRLFRR